MGTRVVKALAFPVFQKDWLFYAWKVTDVPADPLSRSQEQEAQSTGLLGEVSKRVASRIQTEWQSVQEAKEGTLKGYVLR